MLPPPPGGDALTLTLPSQLQATLEALEAEAAELRQTSAEFLPDAHTCVCDNMALFVQQLEMPVHEVPAKHRRRHRLIFRHRLRLRLRYRRRHRHRHRRSPRLKPRLSFGL